MKRRKIIGIHKVIINRHRRNLLPQVRQIGCPNLPIIWLVLVKPFRKKAEVQKKGSVQKEI
jgi:hypothetical protein